MGPAVRAATEFCKTTVIRNLNTQRFRANRVLSTKVWLLLPYPWRFHSRWKVEVQSLCDWADRSERSPVEGNGNPLWIPAWRTHEQRRLVGSSPWSHKKLDMTEATEHAYRQNKPVHSFYHPPVSKGLSLLFFFFLFFFFTFPFLNIVFN